MHIQLNLKYLYSRRAQLKKANKTYLADESATTSKAHDCQQQIERNMQQCDRNEAAAKYQLSYLATILHFYNLVFFHT